MKRWFRTTDRGMLAMVGAFGGLLVACLVVVGLVVSQGGLSSAADSTVQPTLTASPSAAPSTPQAAPAAVALPPLGTLTPPDLAVSLTRAASPRDVRRLRALDGVKHVVVADRGTVRLRLAAHRTKSLRVLGASPAAIRALTPSMTATSTPLWESVARGELTVAYAHATGVQHRLGDSVASTGRHRATASLRIGALATLGLPDTQALLSTTAGRGVGLAPRRELFVVAPSASIDTLTADVHQLFGQAADVTVTRAAPVDQSEASPLALSSIPATYLALYRQAATTCPGLPWTVLAGIGTVETGNGSNVHRSTAGAEGPMQFLPSTWAIYGYDADGDGKADINDPTDAVFSAARYLCAAGAGQGGTALNDAIFSYNHAWWYVREVVVLANEYA